MVDLKVVLLQALYPVGNLALWVPKLQEPLEGCMIGPDGEMTAIQVRMEVLHRFYYGQQLLPGDTVLLFSSIHGSAVVSHDSLLVFLHL